MTEQPQLHGSIVAMVSLAAGIAAKHPHMGLCQLRRLREMGVPEQQLDAVVEIARHIRDEAGEKLDAAFDKESAATVPAKAIPINAECGCTPTAGGQSCC